MSAEQRVHDAKPGDLIKIYRPEYQHWVVYVGKEEVVGLPGPLDGENPSLTVKEAEVKLENIWDVIGNDNFIVCNLWDKKYKPRKENVIVKEARQQVGQKRKFSWETSNSEHFAKELRYGKKESLQRVHDVKPGDLIKIDRGMYQHWVVYIGDDEVVHLTSPNEGDGVLMNLIKGEAVVKRENMWRVIGQDKFKVDNLWDEEYEPRKVAIILKEADEMVGQKMTYSLLSYNSEHFATERRYGKAESWQVTEVLLSAGAFLMSTKREHDAKPGDLIMIYRGKYHHWVVYIGDEEVVGLARPNEGDGVIENLTNGEAEVKRDNMWRVIGQDKFKVYNSWDKEYKPRDVADILTETREMVGQKMTYEWFPHCSEHFAMERRYGKKESWRRQHDAKPGDMIEFFRTMYQHWAVYIGEDDIVHLPGPYEGDDGSGGSVLGVFNSKTVVKRDKIWDVAGKDEFRVSNYLDEKYEHQKVKDIVEECLGMVDQTTTYKLLSYNCEHFATERRYGIAVSWQVKYPLSSTR